MSVERIQDEGKNCKDFLLSLFVGNQIGSGSYRRVYALKGDSSKVLKVEYCGTDFCNVHEMQVWDKVKGTPIEQWFAPCYEIDVMGIGLVQARTTPFENADDFRKAVKETPTGKIPGFFDDAHYGNFGMLEGRLVCHDYGFTHFLEQGVEAGWRAQQLIEEKLAKRKRKKK